MKWMICLLGTLSVLATDSVNFFDILVEVEEHQLRVRTRPSHLFAYKFLRDKEYSIPEGAYDYMLDANFRQVAFLMRTLERNRGSIHKKSTEPLPILKYRLDLAVRTVTGEELELVRYEPVIGLAAEPGKGLITCEGFAPPYMFDIERLTEKETYEDFINHLAFPFEERLLKRPAAKEFLVDLYFRWPRVVVDKDDFSVFDLFPSAILWDQGLIRRIKIHLGTTYCYRDEQGWQQARSEHLRIFRDAIDTYTGVLERISQGDTLEAIHALEEYLSIVPGDKKALKKLMDFYIQEGKNEEALDLITRYQPFFATIRDGLPNQEKLSFKAERHRNQLLGRRATFAKDAAVLLQIVSPVDNDLVTGTTTLEFALSGNDSHLLQIECFLGEERIATLTEPPFKAKFNVDGIKPTYDLRVVAYFENETYQDDAITIRSLRVDEEERVDLVALRASVFQVKAALDRELTKDDFEIRENKKVKPIAHFRKETAPLRVAILVDASISMVGEKLYNAQYAIKTFLSKMDAEDRVSIYTFGDRVMRLSDFTNAYDQVVPKLMTLSIEPSTSLYDAMLVAHDGLIGQNGTKIMIVISDGDDSNSATTDIHVAKMLRRSPVMVYSVILPGWFGGSTEHGARFLKAMADLTGSNSTRLRSVQNLDETLGRIYQDLRSFYYMDYYTDLSNPDQRKIRVKLKASGTKVRIRTLN